MYSRRPNGACILVSLKPEMFMFHLRLGKTAGEGARVVDDTKKDRYDFVHCLGQDIVHRYPGPFRRRRIVVIRTDMG